MAPAEDTRRPTDPGGNLDVMGRYLPAWVKANLEMRAAFDPKDKAASEAMALSHKVRELIIIALEIGIQHGGEQGRGRQPGVGHTRKAVREAGVTPREIAEMVAITSYICGQPALADYGVSCILAAEEEYAKLPQDGGAA